MFNPHNPQTANQPQLPFSNAPIDWLEPVECGFGQLSDVVATASRAGFVAVRLHVIKLGYRVEFQRETPPFKPSAVSTPPHNQNTPQATPAHGAGVRLDAIK